MTHAFCITSYHDFTQLSSLLQLLTENGYDCYVHIDKKSKIPSAFTERWADNAHVMQISSQRIYWGSYRHVLAVLELLQSAANSKTYSFYHIISENTMPICTKTQLEAFFNTHAENSFLELVSAHQQDAAASRTRYFYFQHLFNTRSLMGLRLERLLILAQRLLHVHRRFCPMYKGYLYCHLNKNFVAWLLQNKSLWQPYLRKLRYCYVGEEYFFQNLIMQSPFAGLAVNDALIFDVWNSPERGLPAVLAEEDKAQLENSEKLFARKFSSQTPALAELFTMHFISN